MLKSDQIRSDQIRFSFDNLINYILKFQLTDIENGSVKGYSAVLLGNEVLQNVSCEA